MLIKILFESSLVDLKLEGASYSSCSVIDVAFLPISWGDLANSFKPLLHHVDINLLISIKFSFDRCLKPEKALIVLLPTIHPDSLWCVVICQTKEQQILEWNYHNRRHVLTTGTCSSVCELISVVGLQYCFLPAGLSSLMFVPFHKSFLIMLVAVDHHSCYGIFLVALWYAIMSHVFERRTNFGSFCLNDRTFVSQFSFVFHPLGFHNKGRHVQIERWTWAMRGRLLVTPATKKSRHQHLLLLKRYSL